MLSHATLGLRKEILAREPTGQELSKGKGSLTPVQRAEGGESKLSGGGSTAARAGAGPVGGAEAPHCSILAAERRGLGRAELARPAAVPRPLVGASASEEPPAGPPALAAAAAARSPATRKRSLHARLRGVGGLRRPGGRIPNLQGTAVLPGLAIVNR